MDDNILYTPPLLYIPNQYIRKTGKCLAVCRLQHEIAQWLHWG